MSDQPTPVPLARAFRFCPGCGATVEAAALGRNPLVCASCGFMFYFSPVTGVVCIIGNDEGEVLLLVRNRDPGRGLYGLPGGFVDPGESADEAAAREVREEVGLEVTGLNYLGSFANEYPFRGVTIPVTDLIYDCRVASLEGIRPARDEIARCVLCRPGPAELSRMAFDSNRRGLIRFLERRAANGR